MKQQVSEAVARPVRGLGQGGAGWVVTEAIEAFGLYDFTDRQYGLAVFLLSALFSFLQTTAENRGWLKPVLRSVPPKTVPVTDDLETADLTEDFPVAQEDQTWDWLPENDPRTDDMDPDERGFAAHPKDGV